VDVVIANNSRPSAGVLKNYAAEHKAPLELGELDPSVEAVLGPFWKSDIARHDRQPSCVRRLGGAQSALDDEDAFNSDAGLTRSARRDHHQPLTRTALRQPRPSSAA
jgi:hypothetical protein